jgi:adenylate cyclase
MRHLELNPEDTRALYLCGGSMVDLGDEKEGLELVNRAVGIAPRDIGVLYNVACVYARSGRTEQALDLLEQAVAAGYSYRAWMENDSDFDPLREHPRFLAILESM